MTTSGCSISSNCVKSYTRKFAAIAEVLIPVTLFSFEKKRARFAPKKPDIPEIAIFIISLMVFQRQKQLSFLHSIRIPNFQELMYKYLLPAMAFSSDCVKNPFASDQ